MKKEELKKKLEPKKFNDVTMEFLTTAVNDVLELYGEYISEDVIIERIKQIIKLVIFLACLNTPTPYINPINNEVQL